MACKVITANPEESYVSHSTGGWFEKGYYKRQVEPDITINVSNYSFQGE